MAKDHATGASLSAKRRFVTKHISFYRPEGGAAALFFVSFLIVTTSADFRSFLFGWGWGGGGYRLRDHFLRSQVAGGVDTHSGSERVRQPPFGGSTSGD